MESVLLQSVANWELWIIDDGSTDGTKALVDGYSDPRIHYLYQVNQGRSAARNLGIQNARGDYVCFLDSDDWFDANHLQVLNDTIDPDLPQVYRTNFRMVQNGRIVGQGAYCTSKDKQEQLHFFLQHMAGIHTLCFPKEALKHHSFPMDFPDWEDTHLLLRVLLEYPFQQINHITCTYRIHDLMSSVAVHPDRERERVIQNVTAIQDFFETLSPTHQSYFPKSLQQEVIAMKFVHHANRLFDLKRYPLSDDCIKMAIQNSLTPSILWWYVKYIFKRIRSIL